MSIIDEARAKAVEALDRLTQIALDNTSEDVHDAVYEDAKRVRAEWQSSLKVEAALSEADRELVAEARVVAGCRGCSLHGPSVVHRLADAFERTSRPVQVEVTDEMVNRAGRTMYVTWDEWAEVDIQAEGIHAFVRSALEAALGGGE